MNAVVVFCQTKVLEWLGSFLACDKFLTNAVKHAFGDSLELGQFEEVN